MTGTILGGLIGSFLLIFSLSIHFVLPVIAIAVSCFLYSYYLPKSYKTAVVFVTIMLVMMVDLTEEVTWEIAAYRLFFTVIGGVLAVGGAYFLWPNWETLQFPLRISKALLANRSYLQQIEHEVQIHNGFHPRVIADRRKAEIENINLETSLKAIKMEPYRIRSKIKNAEDMVVNNKSLTRELTSFAASLPELKHCPHFPEAIEMLELLRDVLNQLAIGIRKEDEKKLINEIEMNSLVMDTKIEILKDTLEEKGGSMVTTKESPLVPYLIFVSELKKIAEPIKNLIKLNSQISAV